VQRSIAEGVIKVVEEGSISWLMDDCIALAYFAHYFNKTFLLLWTAILNFNKLSMSYTTLFFVGPKYIFLLGS